MDERQEPSPSRDGIVPAEIVEGPAPDDAAAMAHRRQARLTWIMAVLAGATTVAQFILQARSVAAGGRPMGWLFAPLALLAFAAGGWAFVLLVRYSRQRGVLGHALTGFLLNVAALSVCAFGVSVVYGIQAAREAKNRPPPDRVASKRVGLSDNKMEAVKEAKMSADFLPPDTGKVLESSLDPQPLKVRPGDVQPEGAADDLIKGSKPLDWGRWVTLNLTGEYKPQQCVWSGDGKWLYVLNDQTLHQIAVPDFRVQKRFSVACHNPEVVLTQQGLVLSRPQNHDLLLLDPDSLAVKKRVMLDAALLVGSANLPYVITAGPRTSDNQSSDVLFVDVGAARLLAEFKIKVPWGFRAVTPDGKYLLCRNGTFVHRFALRDHKLVFEQNSYPAGYDERILYVSRDSKYLAMRQGRDPYAAAPAGKNDYGVALYLVNDLRGSKLGLPSPLPLLSMTDNPRTGDIYALAADHSDPGTTAMQIYSPQGALRNTIRLPMPAGHARWILADPLGRGLLVAGPWRVDWLELP